MLINVKKEKFVVRVLTALRLRGQRLFNQSLTVAFGFFWSFLAVGSSVASEPVYIGFDGAYAQKTSTSAQAIELGTQLAISQINGAGGVLNGRPLVLVTKDNHGLAARAKDNFIEFAERPDVVAV